MSQVQGRRGHCPHRLAQPCEFNGIKIFSGDGYKLPDALEEQIEAIVLDHVDTPPVPVGGDLGTVSTAPNVVRDYVDHVKSTVPFSLDGLRIAIDCANGASCRTAETLFTELGAECHMLANEPNGVNVNDKCGSTHMEALMEYVKTHDVDAGIAFDGDATAASRWTRTAILSTATSSWRFVPPI